MIASLDKLRTGPITSFADRVFESAINRAIEETEQYYEQMLYREALRVGKPSVPFCTVIHIVCRVLSATICA